MDHHSPEPDRAAAPRVSPVDLLGRLTLDEKIALLHQHAPAVDRLGLRPYTTGTECLHGLSWTGVATVFPQPVGLASTWDVDLLARVGRAVGTEVRAKHAEDPSIGLNVWAPVVNTLRHPLWGRNEEGYSEDPDLTAALATGYCQGLRGEDPDVWLTVPTLKHYLGYGNETDRSATSSHLPPQSLREYELPAFQGPLAAGVVGAVMPSYNLVNGRPNHVATELLDELRTWADGSVAVVSDAQAPSSLVDVERFFPDHVTSHAAALRAGIDSFTDNSQDVRPTIERITAALGAGLVDEADIDRAVLRLLELRDRTGELSGADPYRVPATAIDTAEHRALAREASTRGVVLLANDGGALPLGEPTSIAVVGPFAAHVVHDWYSGTPPYVVTLADALAERYPDAEVRVATGADRVALFSRTHQRYLAATPTGDAVTATSVTVDATSQFDVTDWGHGVLSLRSVATGAYLSGQSWIQRADADRIGGWVVQETYSARTQPDGSMSLLHIGSGKWLRIQNGTHLLVADGTEATAERFSLETLVSGSDDVARACAGADAVLVAVGNDPHVAGRETEDRPDLLLGATAATAWSSAAAAHDRPILVIVSSYPYAVQDEAAQAGAVVWSSHAGQELGHGLVDVLSGDVNPSGRIAQTWWRRVEDAGDLLDYDVTGAGGQGGQTYRYAEADPLYGLGHGLGYSEIAYRGLELSAGSVAAPAPTLGHTPARDAEAPGTDLTATVTVENTGDRPVDELVAVYSHAPQDLTVRAPRRRLLAWTRVEVAPHSTLEVRLPLPLGALAVWDVAATAPDRTALVATPGAYVVQPGAYVVASGPSVTEAAVTAPLTVTGPEPAVLRPGTLPAAAFHSYRSLVTSARERTLGSCVEVHPAHEAGWAQYGRIALDGARVVRILVARRWLPASSAPRVRLTAGGTGWAPLTEWADVTSTEQYDWQELRLELLSPPAGPVDLRVEIEGAARVAELIFD
ncbi:glycoside hydrolase family 3 C-terminal domain-containing protein [Cellulomonas fengjieae]|uniref:glycoside hydrolase family 3 C-terminal domain-containing protein n=1 Tax=Cellulomonas fengjieae TaxID=2819978 RepID=UPI001AAF7526|nr:glycoside hydrolase family 3 C-terminal domain-containing protein [Cellulomonas fengjieae]MBO3101516.1 glycoside hydrolase family 3 C-terminal domain-containing protein [Cellulomonas fengjieae]